jgi:hypothetical protein
MGSLSPVALPTFGYLSKIHLAEVLDNHPYFIHISPRNELQINVRYRTDGNELADIFSTYKYYFIYATPLHRVRDYIQEQSAAYQYI